MTWKKGKYGHHTGRTVRSQFARGSSRSEGILVRKVRQTGPTPEESHTESVVDSTHYSLGKQNRWLIPEMIKTSARPREVVGEESDFLLVEQRMNERGTQNGRRGNCVSVYNSSTKRTRRPRRKYGQVQSLMRDLEKTDLEFEVLYPDAKGVWPHNSEVKYGQRSRGKRKGSSKNRRGKWNESHWSPMVDEEDSYFTEEDEEYFDDNAENIEGDGDMYIYTEEKSRIRFISLGDHIIEQVTVVPCIQRSSRGNPACNQENSNTKENIIIIDDEELITEHKKSVSTARKMDALIRKCLNFNSTFNSFTKYGMNVKKSQRKKRKALMEYAKQLNDEFEREIQADPSAVTEKENISKESFSFAPEIESSCEVGLQEAAIRPSVLKQTWGENYQEGHCFPRKFAIDLSGLIKCSSDTFDLAVMVLLFEKHEKEDASKICKASIKLVLHNELAELNTSHKLNEQIKTEFIDTISENCSNVFSVSNIVDVGLKCIKKYEILQREKPLNVSSLGTRKPFCTTNVFEDVLGWRGKSCTEKEALAMLKKEVNRGNQEIDPQISCASSTPAAECGICFEGDQTHTTLISCGHSFCNSCWEFYIKTVLNLGETNLFCPAHQCQTQIDNIVIMSLATSWYGKYISWKIKRNLSKSLTLKHCPSEGCDLVVQVKPCDENSRKLISDPLPVVCACGQTWCFQCQEPAHWPSHCDKAQQFRAEYKEYARKIKRDQVKKEITSVMVKKCPNCKYPIEKFHGCDHMHCGLCGVHFCWRCLSCKLAEDHNYYDCKFRSVASSEILLPRVNKSRTQTLVDIALSNCLARRASNMLGLQRKLKSMEQGLQAYGFLKKNVLKKSKTSRITSVLEGMVQLNTLQLVKDAFNFKLQAHVVLEGLAIILINPLTPGHF